MYRLVLVPKFTLHLRIRIARLHLLKCTQISGIGKVPRLIKWEHTIFLGYFVCTFAAVRLSGPGFDWSISFGAFHLIKFTSLLWSNRNRSSRLVSTAHDMTFSVCLFAFLLSNRATVSAVHCNQRNNVVLIPSCLYSTGSFSPVHCNATTDNQWGNSIKLGRYVSRICICSQTLSVSDPKVC